ncbi:MAG TPA: ABC transporter ATP-binding protein [Ramlibacter sp.]|uniref:ABC transporter ATP-binding protein n=1 Tax=Ramlibacter sp. TaxID=1917967 RepID=UPI002D80F3C8|nr:ABC transporter ATP-binding protein [Ramlibacter sp.]HET8744034.1 ABC transporter ATP-binding protein [Ramlibacter sp.]
MSCISVDDLSIKFRLYHDRSPSLKDYVAGMFRAAKPTSVTDFWAISHVSFRIGAGERVGIVGHNGAGKSTLLKALCRIYEPTSGSVQVQGRIAPLLEIGAGFHPEFAGRENIYLNGAILGYSKAQLRAIEHEIIAFADLEEFIDTPVKYYSTGMYLRLAFSLATSVQPEILILDEMFAGGDANFVQKATARMHKVIEGAKILVVVSHDLDLLERTCTRVIWMDHGRIKHDGPAKEVVQLYRSSTATRPVAA